MAEKTQNNNTDTKKTPAPAVPKANAKPRFSCKDCTFTCNSHINFRVHLRSIHKIELPSEHEKPQAPKKPTAVVIQKPPVVYTAPPQTTAGIVQKPPVVYTAPPQTTAGIVQKPPVVYTAPPQTTAGIVQTPPMVQKSPVPTAIVLQKSTMAPKTPVPTAIGLQKSIMAPQTTAGKIQNNNPSFKAFPSQDLKTIYSWKNPTVGPKSLGPQNTGVKIQDNNIGNQNESLKTIPNPNAKPVNTWKTPTTVEKTPVPQTTAENIQNNGNQNAAPKAAPKPKIIKSQFACKECNFSCNSIQNYKTHLQNVHGKPGGENTQNSSTQKKAEKPKGKDAPTPKPDKPKKRTEMFHPDILFNPSGKEISKLKDYISRTDREPLIGLEYVLEYRFKTAGNQIVTKYFCELCECDTDLDPIVEHLAGFRHRKQYLEREYPYVLKAQSSSKEEERSQFIRRMALEIEREEGTKMYMIDHSVWMETMMTLRTADKKMRKKTRWDDDRNDQNRMAKALKFLESFEVENELEATTVARLCEKLNDNMKMFNNKTKEDSLFPARVARAQDVAMSLMQNAAKQRTHVQNLTQMNLRPKISIVFNKGQQMLPENTSKAFVSTFVPLHQQQGINRPPMPQSENQSESVAKNLNQEDTQFFKRLMALLEALPQNASISDSSEMNSKLLVLKSLLVNQKSEEHERANQQLMRQVASMVQETISAQNASINKQLMMLMGSQNSSMVVQTAPLPNNLVQRSDNSVISNVGLVPGMQSSGNMLMNPLMPLNQNLGNQVYGQMGETAPRPVNLNNYQVPRVEMQNYPSTSQKYDNLGYGTSMERSYLPKVDPFISQPAGIATGGKNEQMPISKTNVGYEPRVYDKKWDDSYYDKTSVPENRFVDRTGKQAPYTRVSLSPSSPQNNYDSYDARGRIGMEDTRQQPSLRAYGSSDWADQDNDMRYKRARLDTENRADRPESYHNQSLQALGINTAGLPEEILNRIKGKDFLTASAILSDYSARRSGK